MAEAIIDKLDAAEPDLDLEEDNEDACQAEDTALPGTMGLGEADDAEPEPDDEDGDPQGDGRDDADMPVFPPSRATTLRAEQEGLIRVRRQVDIVRISKTGRRQPQRVWWERLG